MKIQAALKALIVIIVFAAAGLAETGDGLEGTDWKLRPAGLTHFLMFWDRDYLVFRSGNFIEAGLAKSGFSPSLYSAVKTGDGIVWEAELRSPESGRIAWKGARVSCQMTGTFTWTRPDGSSKTVRWKARQIF